MAAVDSAPVPGESFEQTMLSASPELVREMIRLVGAVLVGQDDEWTERRRYVEPNTNRLPQSRGEEGKL